MKRVRSFFRSLLCFTLFVVCAFAGSAAHAQLGGSVTVASGQPTDIFPGQTTQLEITLSNASTIADLTSVAFSNSLPGALPGGLSVASAASFNCFDPVTGMTDPGVGSITAVPGSQTISLSGGEIPQANGPTAATCTIIIPVTAGSSDGSLNTLTYTIGDGAVTGLENVTPVANIGSVSQSVNVLAIQQPSIAKSFSNSTPILGGASSRLTVTVTNPNASVAIPNFDISDTFPLFDGSPLIEVAATPNASATCAGGVDPSFAPVAGAVSIAATGGTVAASGSCTIAADIVAAQTGTVFQTPFQTNRIDAATEFTNDLGLEAAADATANVRARSPFSVAKTFSSPTLAGNGTSTADLTVRFTNNGDTPLVVSSFTDDPIDGNPGSGVSFGLTLTGVPTISCPGGVDGTLALTTGNQGFTLTSPATVAAGGVCTINGTFNATPEFANQPITYTNSIPQGTIGLPAGIVSQSASAAILVVEELQVLKSASPADPAPGAPVEYTVTVNNFSASVISNLQVNDTFTNGQTFLTGIVNGLDFNPTLTGAGCGVLVNNSLLGDGAANLVIGSVPAMVSGTVPGSCAVTFYAQTDPAAADGASVDNVLGAGDVTDGGLFVNGSPSTMTSATIVSPSLSLVKAFTPAGPLPENTVSTLRVDLANLSANPITSLGIVDNLPAANTGTGQMALASPPNFSTTCGTPGTVTAVAGATSIAFDGGEVPARASNGTGAAGSCFFEVDIIAPAGIYDNTATANATETLSDGSTRITGPINSNTAQIVYTSSLGATKSFLPAAVSDGGVSRVTVTLTNSASLPLTGVSVIDPLPADMVLADPINPSTTCAGMSMFTGVAGGSTITFSDGELPGNGTCDVLFDVVASGASDLTNTIPAGNITADGGVENQTAVSGVLNLNPPTPILVSKAFSPSTLSSPGQVSQLTITFTAGATTDLTNVSVTDFFTTDGTSGAPLNGSQLTSAPNAVTDCTGGTLIAPGGGTSIELSGASLSANSSCTITADVTTIIPSGITNTIPTGAIVTDQGLTNPGPGTTSLTTSANLGVLKSFTPNAIEPGARSRLRITFFNPTLLPAANISVLDTFPANVNIAPGPNPTTDCVGASIAPQFGTGPGGQDELQITGANLPGASAGTASSCVVEIDVTSSVIGEFTNLIGVGDVTADIGGVSVSNAQPTSDILRVLAPLTINKAFDGSTLDTGSPNGLATGSAATSVGVPSTLTIRLTNSNAVAITQVALNDALPAGLFVAPTPNASTTCVGGAVNAVASAASIGLTGATIPSAGSCDVDVDVISNIVDSYVNTIAAGEVSSFEGITNEEPTSAELVISDPPSVGKEFSPVVIGSGGTSQLTLFLGNDNDTPATLGATFTDNFPTAPGALIVATPNNLGGTCPGGVTATPGAGSVSYANGAIIPVGGCTIVVDVTATTPGTYNNSIPAGDLQTNFGNNPDPANAMLEISTLGFISGRVFADNNVTPNGVFDAGVDNILSGQTIELRSGADCSGALLSSDVTDAAGNYAFTLLPAGTYSVCQPAQPSGTLNGTTSAGTIIASNGSTGSVGTASNSTATTSQIVSVVLNGDGGGGEVSGSPDNNFAEVIPSTLSGTVFLDENNNGLQNGVDAGLGGETIQLLDNVGTVINTTTTAADGSYSFSGLPPGTYSIRQLNQPANTSDGMTVAGSVGNGGTPGTPTVPTALPSEITGIVLPPNTVSPNNNFAELPNTRTISGLAFVDLNTNSVFGTGDFGLDGITLNLTGVDENGVAVSDTTTTDADGNYSFTGLPAGTYTVSQPNQPGGTTNAVPVAGSTGGAATNPTATSSQIAAIDLTGLNMLSAGNNFPEIPGAGPDLTILKTHSPVNFAEGSSGGIFTLAPSNVGTIDTSGTITIVDTLPAGLTLTSRPTGTGWSCSGNTGASNFTCTSTDIIASGGGAGNPITVPVNVDSGLAGQLLTNNVVISGGGEPPGLTGNNEDDDTVAITSSASISGRVWFDLNSDNVFDAGTEDPLSGWTAELLLGGVVVGSDVTDANGQYTIGDLSPGSGYELVFREPTTGEIFGGAITNETGQAIVNGARDTGTTPNAGTNGGNPAGGTAENGMLTGLTILAGDNVVEQSLPLDPAGVVYNAVTRDPVAGAEVTITGPGGFVPATDLVGGAAAQTVTTGASGFYQFLFLPTAPSGVYTLEITSYPGGFIPLPSTLIPVCDVGVPVDVLAAPDPANIQAQVGPPPLSATIVDPLAPAGACPATTAGLNAGNQASTQHFFTLDIDTTLGGSADVLNNHIPLDPIAAGAVNVIKTTPVVSTSIGQFVPYTITVNNSTAIPFDDVDVVDVIPAGFSLVEGSGSLDGVATQPAVNGNRLTWTAIDLPANASLEFRVILVVGSGVDVGEFTNQAFVNLSGTTISNVATATVRVVPDPVFDCSDLIGKVFDDQNFNGYQDKGEPGIANVRLASVNGLLITTDDHGRFHVACADVPDAQRGSNFLLKLDERTLPSGYRVTTENPRVVRLTRGKLGKINFGAAIHRVIRVDVSDAAFEKGGVALKENWQREFEGLVDVLRNGPAVLRFGYELTIESKELAKDRVAHLTETLEELWDENDCCHEVMIEHEFVRHSGRAEGGR